MHSRILLQMLQSDWLRYLLSIRQLNIEWQRVTRQGQVFRKKQCLFVVFRSNFEELTNTNLFLLKQLDYSLSVSIKR